MEHNRVIKASQLLLILTIMLSVIISGCSAQPEEPIDTIDPSEVEQYPATDTIDPSEVEPFPVLDIIDSSSEDWYIYPVTPRSPEWKGMSVQSKLKACRIPDDTLKTLSDNALVKAIADFPFLVDLYACDDISYAAEFFSTESDAYKEVLSRQDPGHIMLNGLNALPVYKDEASEHYIHDTIGLLILFDERLDGSYTRNELIEVADHTCAALLVRLEDATQYDLPERFRRTITLSDGSQVVMLWYLDGRPEGTNHTI